MCMLCRLTYTIVSDFYVLSTFIENLTENWPVCLTEKDSVKRICKIKAKKCPYLTEKRNRVTAAIRTLFVSKSFPLTQAKSLRDIVVLLDGQKHVYLLFNTSTTVY